MHLWIWEFTAIRYDHFCGLGFEKKKIKVVSFQQEVDLLGAVECGGWSG